MVHFKSLRFSFALAFFMISSLLFSQVDPPLTSSAGELSYYALSPALSGKGVQATDNSTPHGVLVNPAAAASFQRYVLDVNYFHIQDFKSPNPIGAAANVGVSIPTLYGVLTPTLNFFHTPDSANPSVMEFGTMIKGGFSFSRLLYPNFAIGGGVTISGGASQEGQFEIGAGVSAGFIHSAVVDIPLINNFSWALAINNIGLPFGTFSRSYFDGVPEALTPMIGARLDLFDTEPFRWGLEATAAAPAFSDLRLTAGTEIELFSLVTFSSSIQGGLIDLASGYTFVPSFGISFTFRPQSGKDKKETNFFAQNEYSPHIAYTPLYDNIHLFGLGLVMALGGRDRTPPEVEIDFEEESHYSPNFDGIRDGIDAPLVITDDRFIAGYRFTIYDENGDVIRTSENKEQRAESIVLESIITRLQTPIAGIPVPETLNWDGRSDDGEVVPDGRYSFHFQAWDDNGNNSEIVEKHFILDTQPPEALIAKGEGDALIFSPDGDGNKDLFSLTQEGSEEDSWNGGVWNTDGVKVRNFDFAGGVPVSEVTWDGKDDKGLPLPDGVYSYVIESTDRAGNYGNDRLGNIVINTARPFSQLTIDAAYIAPGNPAGRQTVSFQPTTASPAALVSWEVNVKNVDGDQVRSLNSGGSNMPSLFPYDGKDDNGSVLPDGEYFGELTLRYNNGYEPVQRSAPFTVDNIYPEANVSASVKIFSPNGDGRKDFVTLKQKGSSEEEWRGEVRASNGSVVKAFTWLSSPEASIEWNGLDEEGRIVADGEYSYVLSSVDRAGNRGESKPVSFAVDNSETEAAISAGRIAFSPNGDNVLDTVPLYPLIPTSDAVEEYQLEVVDTDKKVVWKSNGSGSVPSLFEWDGKNNSGQLQPEGDYTARLTVDFVKGDQVVTESTPLNLDITPPSLSAQSDYTLFSPEGDGLKDSIVIAQRSSPEKELIGSIVNVEGVVIRSFRWEGESGDFEWDGRDENKNIVPDGEYAYTLSSTDEAGNSNEIALETIIVDNASTPLFAIFANQYVAPDIAGDTASQKFNIISYYDGEIEEWMLEILNEEKEPVRLFSGRGSVPENLEWDGSNDKGENIEGIFTARATISYLKGNRPEAETETFIVDRSAPVLATATAPEFFSPDNDGIQDELTLSVNVDDLSPIGEWSLLIKEPTAAANTFIAFEGKGEPTSEIVWDGRSSSGELVQSAMDYPYELTVTDILGHTSVAEGKIPVDILVIRDGDRYKIMVPSITFKPSSHELVTAGAQGASNKRILDRVAAALRRYATYNITVEGHAASLRWNDPAAKEREETQILEPLSLRRAETVKRELRKRGVAAGRMDTAGVGGRRPAVPHSDAENRWKNRRVEFILEK